MRSRVITLKRTVAKIKAIDYLTFRVYCISLLSFLFDNLSSIESPLVSSLTLPVGIALGYHLPRFLFFFAIFSIYWQTLKDLVWYLSVTYLRSRDIPGHNVFLKINFAVASGQCDRLCIWFLLLLLLHDGGTIRSLFGFDFYPVGTNSL